MIKDRSGIPYMVVESDGCITLMFEKFNPEEVSGEEVIISLFKMGHTVSLKNMAKYDKKSIAFGILKYMKAPNKIDQFRAMWNLHNTIDPVQVDRTLQQILDRIY
jgi:hypothetical protein